MVVEEEGVVVAEAAVEEAVVEVVVEEAVVEEAVAGQQPQEEESTQTRNC